ncbi:aspartate/glutamate racemase family protein [Rhodobacteraceae bacterium D3-12]|nr:aspartate/glutamate racemase family protein [Rhodobacteraceae bacterium D3-12]
MFARAFSARGRDVIYPVDRDLVLTAIRAIKGGDIAAALPILEAAAGELAQAGARVAVIGCSEFSIVAEHLSHAPLALIDSLDVLVDACVTGASD